MATKLNQVIAIEKGLKAKRHGELTELYKVVQKPELFEGFAKQYQKKADDDETLPSESKKVQFSVKDILGQINKVVSDYLDVSAQRDWSNCQASADVVVDGQVVIAKAPVTFLLLLEKDLTDIRTFISKVPVLSDSDEWKQDQNGGLFRTDPIQTHRTKKVQKPIVLYQATDNHPAQTQLITEDITVGYWNTVKQSGALPKTEQEKILVRLDKLINAVKVAREAANSIDAQTVPSVGEAVFGYLFNN